MLAIIPDLLSKMSLLQIVWALLIMFTFGYRSSRHDQTYGLFNIIMFSFVGGAILFTISIFIIVILFLLLYVFLGADFINKINDNEFIYSILLLPTVYLYKNRSLWERKVLDVGLKNEVFKADLLPSTIDANKSREIEIRKKQEEISKQRSLLIPENYIRKFLQHAERNYEKVDKYGNKNTGSLEKEIADYLLMIAKQLGNKYAINSTEAYVRGRNYPPLDEDYRWLISYLRGEFEKYHNEKKEKIASGEANISIMTGIEFEKYLANIFRSSGYIVDMTPESGDQGADIIAEKDTRKIVIQAKRYAGSVGNAAVQEVIGAIRYYGGNEGWVITNSTFTNSARELARVNHITLIDGESLEDIEKLI